MTPVLLLLAATVAAPQAKDAKKDPDTLVGEWVAESLVKRGKPQPVKAGTGITFAAGGKVRLSDGGKDVEATYTTDPKKDPPQIDLVVPEGLGLIGVYKLDGDTLTLCLSGDGERPAGFEAPEGSRALLMVLKRAPKKKE